MHIPFVCQLFIVSCVMLQIMGHFLVYEPSRSVKYDTLSVMASSDGGQNLNNSLISKILDTVVLKYGGFYTIHIICNK